MSPLQGRGLFSADVVSYGGMTTRSHPKLSARLAKHGSVKPKLLDPVAILGAWQKLALVTAHSDDPALWEAALSLVSFSVARSPKAQLPPTSGRPGKRFSPSAPINALVISHLSRVLGYWRVARFSDSLLAPEDFGLLPNEARRVVNLAPLAAANETAWFEFVWSAIRAEFETYMSNTSAGKAGEASSALRAIVQFSLPNKIGVVKDNARAIRINLTPAEVDKRATKKMRNDLRLRALRAFRVIVIHAGSIPELSRYDAIVRVAA